MELPDFKEQPLWINLAVFAACALAVWIAGSRVARYADAIARRTGIGHVLAGMVLLGGITSLPEIAICIFSALAANPGLAVNNLLGGVAMQKAILAGVDGLIGKEALTVVAASSVMLLQAALSMLMLIVVAMGIAAGDRVLFHAGAWSWCLLALYLLSLWMISGARGRNPWTPQANAVVQDRQPGSPVLAPLSITHPQNGTALHSLLWKTVIAAGVILVAGFFLSHTGDGIAAQTGLGHSFVGAVLLALSTSLPELSTTVAAVRLGQYEMAISDILGTNLFNVALIFLVDAVYTGPPVLAASGRLSLAAALLGALLTAIYLIGLVERRNRTIGRMGIDSVASLAVYGGGVFLLYQLR